MSRILFYPQSFGLNNCIVRDLMVKTRTNSVVLADTRFVLDIPLLFKGYRLTNMRKDFNGRRLVRLLESVWLYLKLIGFVLFSKRIEGVVLNIVNWLPHELFFLHVLRLCNIKFELVLHDWNEKQWDQDWFLRNFGSKSKVKSILDSVYVHNLAVHTYNVYNGQNITFPKVLDLPKRDNTLSRDISFLFCGTYRSDKNIESLIKFSNYEGLRVIGGHGFPDEVRALFEQHGWVFIEGYISDERLIGLLQRSKYLLLPYRGGSASAWPQIADYYGCIPIMSKSDAFANYRKYYPKEYHLENFNPSKNDLNKNSRFLDSYV